MNKLLAIPIIISFLALAGFGCQPDNAEPAADQAADQFRADMAAAEKLDLSDSGLTAVPAYVFGQFRLLELDLSDNQLTGALPAEIRLLRNLRVLDASGNKMTGVPAEIGQLTELRELDLSDNQLTGLPLELGNLQNLRRLDLSGNDVSQQDLGAIRAKLTDTEILE